MTDNPGNFVHAEGDDSIVGYDGPEVRTATLLPSGPGDGAAVRQRWSERRWNAVPDTVILNGEEIRIAKPLRPSLVVAADDGTELLRISVTDDGMLDVTGDEDRWTEGAARFAAEVRRMLTGEDGCE